MNAAVNQHRQAKRPSKAAKPASSPRFDGEFKRRLDARHCFRLPAAWRVAPGEDLALFMAGEGRLVAASEEKMERVFDHIESSVPLAERRQRRFALFLAAHPVAVDCRHRIRLDKELHAHLGLCRTVALVGKGDRFEI